MRLSKLSPLTEDQSLALNLIREGLDPETAQHFAMRLAKEVLANRDCELLHEVNALRVMERVDPCSTEVDFDHLLNALDWIASGMARGYVGQDRKLREEDLVWPCPLSEETTTLLGLAADDHTHHHDSVGFARCTNYQAAATTLALMIGNGTPLADLAAINLSVLSSNIGTGHSLDQWSLCSAEDDMPPHGRYEFPLCFERFDDDPRRLQQWEMTLQERYFHERGKAHRASRRDGLVVRRSVRESARSRLPPLGAKEPAGRFDLLDALWEAAGSAPDLGHPAAWAWVPNPTDGADVGARMATLYGNAQGALTILAKSAIERETEVHEYVGKRFGFRKDNIEGIFVRGSSEANSAAILTAVADKAYTDMVASTDVMEGDMEVPLRLAKDRARETGVIFCSSAAHGSVTKAADMAGFSKHQVVELEVDEAGRIDIAKATEKIAALGGNQDRRPLALIATAGTTDTGAMDPLSDLAELCQEHGLWFHVDAAIGGALAFSEEHSKLLDGLEKANSAALCYHKIFGASYAQAALIVQGKGSLRKAFHHSGDYLASADGGPADMGPALSREVNLGVWAILMTHGASRIDRGIQRSMENVHWLQKALDESPHWEIKTIGDLPVVTFRLQNADGDLSDAIIDRMLPRLRDEAKVYLSDTKDAVGDKVLRAMPISRELDEERVNEIIANVTDVALACRAEIIGGAERVPTAAEATV